MVVFVIVIAVLIFFKDLRPAIKKKSAGQIAALSIILTLGLFLGIMFATNTEIPNFTYLIESFFEKVLKLSYKN